MQKNDIARVEYDVWIRDSNQLFDTTHEKVAKEHGVFDENTPYRALPLIVGVGRVPKGFDDAMMGADVGKETTVEIGPTEAYGERDLSKIKTYSIHEFRKQDVMPEYGAQVTIRNKTGTIVGITAGRVRVDFNHPLAGKALKYVFTIAEHVEAPEDKIRAIIEMNYLGAKLEDYTIVIDGDNVSITVPDACKYDQTWFMAKYRIVNDLQQSVGFKDISFIELYQKVEPPAPAEAAPAETEKQPEELDSDEAAASADTQS